MDIELNYNEKGLIPVVTQDFLTGQVLMLAYMNAEALEMTVKTGKVHYFSRSRNELWLKGETSGSYQLVRDIRFDCDSDALLVLAEQIGNACHTGEKTCFYRGYMNNGASVKDPGYKRNTDNSTGDVFEKLYATIEDRRDNPVEGSYTNYLFEKGLDKMLKKVGEESAEVIIAAKNQVKSEITLEISDLIYHLCVVMAESGVSWDDISQELINRSKK